MRVLHAQRRRSATPGSTRSRKDGEQGGVAYHEAGKRGASRPVTKNNMPSCTDTWPRPPTDRLFIYDWPNHTRITHGVEAVRCRRKASLGRSGGVPFLPTYIRSISPAANGEMGRVENMVRTKKERSAGGCRLPSALKMFNSASFLVLVLDLSTNHSPTRLSLPCTTNTKCQKQCTMYVVQRQR